MDSRAIGVFDSGLGGLTAVRELIARLPQEDIIYFGDTGRVPYGSRSKETIIRYAKQDVAFLNSFDLKAIVIACGTISSTAIDELQRENKMPIIGIVEPSAETAAKVTKNKKIGLIATKATVRTGVLAEKIKEACPGAEVYATACPLFVSLVENGRYRADDPVVEMVAREYLEPIKAQGVDTLVMACTHFPLLSEVIGKIMGPEVTLVDTGAESARALQETLEKLDAMNETGHQGSREYYVSDIVDGFEQAASIFLQQNVNGSAHRIEIERY